jgi:hypothetical protein
MKDSVSVKAVWLSAVTKQALAKGVIPVVQIEFSHRTFARSVVPMRWAIIPWGEFEQLLDAQKRLSEEVVRADDIARTAAIS